MANQSIKLLALLLINLISQAQSQCVGISKEECVGKNPSVKSLIPLFNGRCCWNGNSCSYQTDVTPGTIQGNKMECGTEVEKCNAATGVDQNDFSVCYFRQVELPYKCCYLGYRYTRRCIALDISDTKIYGVFEAQFRAIYGLTAEDKLKIDCGSSFTKAITTLLISLLFITIL